MKRRIVMVTVAGAFPASVLPPSRAAAEDVRSQLEAIPPQQPTRGLGQSDSLIRGHVR